MLLAEIYDHCVWEAAEWGIMKIDQAAISLSGHHWKHGLWPPSLLVSLTSARDIITHCPDINPNTAHTDKKSERPFLTGSHPANTGIVRHRDLQLLWVCLRRYEIFMETSDSVVCFHFGSDVFAFAGPGAHWQEEKRLKAQRKEERRG